MGRVAVFCLVAALLVALFRPTLAWLVVSWRADPYYSHGPLVVAVAAWLAWLAGRRYRLSTHARPVKWPLGIGLVACGVILHVVALAWAAYPISAAGLVAVLLGLAALAGGPDLTRTMLFPAILALTAIPLPLADRFAPPMAGAVAGWAAGAVRALGVHVTRTGALLALDGSAFTVGAPCSGLRSLVALGSLAVLWAGLLDDALWKRLIVVAAALPFALAGNWLRLTVLLLVAQGFGQQPALNFFHNVAGPLFFLIATAGVAFVGRQLGCRLKP